MMPHTCRFCRHPLAHPFVDLGMAPLSNAFLHKEQLQLMEPFYPLCPRVCDRCYLVQLEQFTAPENIFSDYVFFSSFSDTWLQHARSYVEAMIGRFGFGAATHVVEIASNDGCLLQCFRERGLGVLGIEPAANVAEVAQAQGIPTLVRFFGRDLAIDLAREGRQADLLVANNVLAHVPDLTDFVAGLKILLKERGLVTVEFPHLLRLMEDNQFDTIYHEHFSYFFFTTAERVLAAHGLTVFDVEESPIHGGSLRIFARHEETAMPPVGPRVADLLRREAECGITDLGTYRSFADRVMETKRNILEFLIQAKNAGKRIVGYGAPAKGNTLLNYCGIRGDFIDYTVDRNPRKQGLFLPGTHIPIEPPERIGQTKPDLIFILPWNLKEEIMEQMAHVRGWGARFVVPIPRVAVY
jgi:2-polyprenyl-3-methyl-5-hydroxy-6-metoxy-1,4-benzoquinol methylase